MQIRGVPFYFLGVGRGCSLNFLGAFYRFTLPHLTLPYLGEIFLAEVGGGGGHLLSPASRNKTIKWSVHVSVKHGRSFSSFAAIQPMLVEESSVTRFKGMSFVPFKNNG